MSNETPRRGRLFILSGPSGSGKTTVVEALIARRPDVVRSVSYTTRTPRGGELDGVSYHFVTHAQFAAMRDGGVFYEWAPYGTEFYGTSRVDSERALAAGRDVFLVIEVKGARQMRAVVPDVVSIFILPPSPGEVRSRLTGRGTDAPAVIARRFRIACEEVQAFHEYDYVLVNDDLDTCVDDLDVIVRAQHLRLESVRARAAAIVGAFGNADDTKES